MGHKSGSDRQSRSSSKHKSSSRHGSVHGDSSVRRRASWVSHHDYDDVEVIAGPSSVRKSRPRSQASQHGFEDAEVVGGPSSVRKSRSRSRSKSRPSSHAGHDDLAVPEPSHSSSRRKGHKSSGSRSRSKSRPSSHGGHDGLAVPEPLHSSSRCKSHRSSRNPHDSASAKGPHSTHRSRSRSRSKPRQFSNIHHYDARPLGPPLPHEIGYPFVSLETGLRNHGFPTQSDYEEYRRDRRNRWISRICCCGCGKWGIMVWVTLIIMVVVLGAVIGHQKNSGGCPVLHDVLFHEEEVHALIRVLGQDSVAEGEVCHGFNLKHGLIIPLPNELDREPLGGVHGQNNLNLTVQGVLQRFLKPAGTQPPENFFLRTGPGRLVGGIFLMFAAGLVLAKIFYVWKGRQEVYERIPEQPRDENDEGCSHQRGLERQWHACETCSLIEG